MGIVTQETILLNTSIQDNIAYGSNLDEKVDRGSARSKC